MKATTQKDAKITLRISKGQKNVLSQAARIRHTSLSNFVLERAFQDAQDTIANQVHFLLDDEKWELFCEALEKPAQSIESVQNLLKQSTVLDE